MIPLVLAATVAAEGEPQTPTLGGVALRSDLTQVLSEHPTAQRSTKDSARWWAWKRRGGGTLSVTADDSGKVNRVDFVADKGEDDDIVLPCAGAFPVQDSHVNLEVALEKTGCSAFNGAAYGVPGGSVVAVRFDGLTSGLGDGQLAEATWYRPSAENPSPVGHINAIIDYLRPALKYVGEVALIYYAATCPPEENGSREPRLLFPAVNLQPPQGATEIAAVRQIFRDDPNVAVARDRSGMLRITLGSVSSTVLQMKIPTLALDPTEQYTALSAIDKIAVTADAYAKKRGLPFGLAPYVIDHLSSGPVVGAPHLPDLMQNLTLDEQLGAVARTFKGMVTYGECMRPDGQTLFQLGFIHGS